MSDEAILPEPEPEPEPAILPPAEEAAIVSAAAKLRTFEDDVFGKDAPRINGAVERGVGSPFARMTEHQKAHHAALEKLVAAEKAVADASAAHAVAEAGHAAAVKLAHDAEKAAADSE